MNRSETKSATDRALLDILIELGVKPAYHALILQSKRRIETSTSYVAERHNRWRHIKLYARALKYRQS